VESKDDGTRPRRFQVWTAPQRAVLLGGLAALVVYLFVRLAFNPTYVSDPQPEQPPRFHELADRIDPNTADWQSLAALPTIGEKRAKDIVEYRDAFVREHPGERGFSRPEDLLRVKGVGRTMVESLTPYLTFGEGDPATRPAE
jgi:hypothetical protein